MKVSSPITFLTVVCDVIPIHTPPFQIRVKCNSIGTARIDLKKKQQKKIIVKKFIPIL